MQEKLAIQLKRSGWFTLLTGLCYINVTTCVISLIVISLYFNYKTRKISILKRIIWRIYLTSPMIFCILYILFNDVQCFEDRRYLYTISFMLIFMDLIYNYVSNRRLLVILYIILTSCASILSVLIEQTVFTTIIVALASIFGTTVYSRINIKKPVVGALPAVMWVLSIESMYCMINNLYDIG